MSEIGWEEYVDPVCVDFLFVLPDRVSGVDFTSSC